MRLSGKIFTLSAVILMAACADPHAERAERQRMTAQIHKDLDVDQFEWRSAVQPSLGQLRVTTMLMMGGQDGSRPADDHV